jgi:sulfhydrogenase subunit gamma (sulfur reductase)
MESPSLFVPEIADVVRVQPLTDSESLYELRLPGGRPLGHAPGQFVEVSLFGIGEAPLSICSSPLQADTFEMVVRRVGNVTEAIHRLKEGDRAGIRGPFGTGFSPAEFEGKDVLFLAAGLGLPPLRSLITTLLDPRNRPRYGRVMILYGVKSPAEMLFADDRAAWQARTDVELHETVDRPATGWTGNVGVITTLVPGLRLDLPRTVAAICGPPVMYKYALLALRARGLRDDQVWVSLERRMKCGVGKCGHCQMDNVYVCQDGPVFNYARIRDLKEAIQ